MCFFNRGAMGIPHIPQHFDPSSNSSNSSNSSEPNTKDRQLLQGILHDGVTTDLEAEAMRMTAGDHKIAKMRAINGAYYLMFHRLPNLSGNLTLF